MGAKDAFALFVLFYEDGQFQVGWRTAPTIFDHSFELSFTVEIIVSGKKYGTSPSA